MDWHRKILPHPRRPHGKYLLMAVLGLLLVLAGAAFGLAGTHKGEALLGSRAADAAGTSKSSTPALPPSRLLAAPDGRITNATAPLRITLAAPVSESQAAGRSMPATGSL